MRDFAPGCVPLNPASLLWPPSASVLEGVTNTSRKVTPRSHLHLAASPAGPTPHTHLVSSQGPEAGSGPEEVTRGQTAPRGKAKSEEGPLGQTLGWTHRRGLGWPEPPTSEGLEEGEAFLSFLFPRTLPCSRTLLVSPLPFRVSNSSTWIYLPFLGKPERLSNLP